MSLTVFYLSIKFLLTLILRSRIIIWKNKTFNINCKQYIFGHQEIFNSALQLQSEIPVFVSHQKITMFLHFFNNYVHI